MKRRDCETSWMGIYVEGQGNEQGWVTYAVIRDARALATAHKFPHCTNDGFYRRGGLQSLRV